MTDTEDYTAVDMNVTFVAGETTVAVMVAIINNLALEADERFDVVMSSMSADVIAVMNTVTVTIHDDDGEALREFCSMPMFSMQM